jgi:N-acetylglucosaminyldiphosphoundecaprenol N-acetyl-beta-D-mannosaminyltransferase
VTENRDRLARTVDLGTPGSPAEQAPAPVPVVGETIATVRIGGIPTARITRAALARRMVEDVRSARAGTLRRPKVVIATNGQVIALYHRDAAFRALVDAAEIVDPDGMPLILASRLFLRDPLPERVATTDFIWDAAARAEEAGMRFFLLGGRPGVAEATAARLAERHPRLQIAGVRHGYFDSSEIEQLCAEISDTRTDVLWVGLGSPLQERFAIEHRDRLGGVGWVRTCGGLFDHIGGNMPRAPVWVQKLGFEWFHRMMLEPRRLGLRYLLTNPAAAYHLITKTG